MKNIWINHLFYVLLFLIISKTITACGGNRSYNCIDDQDCIATETCINEMCRSFSQNGDSCNSDQDCREGTWCAENICTLSRDIICYSNDECPPDADCDTSIERCSLPRNINNNTNNNNNSNMNCTPGATQSCTCSNNQTGNQICSLSGISWGVCTCNGTNSSPVCTPGSTQPCVCSNTKNGSQVCASTGSFWGDCRCDNSNTPGCSNDQDCSTNQFCNMSTKQCESKKTETSCQNHSDCQSNYACDLSQNKCSSTATFVKIRIEDAMIGPGTASGEGWDGGELSTDVIKKLTSSLTNLALKKTLYGFEEYFAVGDALGEILALLIGLSSPPDPQGVAEFISGASQPYEIQLPEQSNRFNPKWGLGWESVPFNKDLKIRIVLEDNDHPCIVKDPCNDGIGTAIINYNHLVAAYWKGEIVQINVSQQTKNQILFIGISVVKQN